MEQKALITTIKTVVIVVKNLDDSRRIFEDGLGLKCVGEEANESFWGLENVRIARFAREGEDFGCVDLVENPNAVETIRDAIRAWDYGILTLNYRTNNISKAVAKLESLGAKSVSEILQYNVGKLMSEKMMVLPTGERLTIIQIGDATDDEPFFREAIATSGMVVPSMNEAKDFYQNILGLTVSIEFQAAGSPFDKLLGVKELKKLDFATLTSDGNWTGKVELLELDIANEASKETIADGNRTGYWINTFLTTNLDALCKNLNVESIEISRPFHGKVRACLVTAIGGEMLEILEIDS